MALALMAAGSMALLGGDSEPAAPGGPRPPALAPASHYVHRGSPDCRDRRTVRRARSAQTPWCSLRRALGVAPPGAVVDVRGGPYPRLEANEFSRPAYVTLRGRAGEAVTLAGVDIRNSDHLRLEAFRIDGRFEVLESARDLQVVGNELSRQRSGMFLFGWEGQQVRDVLIERNLIRDIDYTGEQGTGEGYGIQLTGSISHVTIRDNTIQSVAEDYIQGGGSHITVERNRFLGPGLRYTHPQAHADLWQIFAPSEHITFRNNVVRDTGTNNGILIQFSGQTQPHRDVTIENNAIYNGSDGYDMTVMNTQGLRIVNNTFVGSRWGVALRRDPIVDDGSGYVVVNNIFDASEGDPFSMEEPWGREDHNLIRSRGDAVPSALGPHDVIAADPGFVDSRGGDLRLRSGSPAIDAGTADEGPERDLDGNARRGDPDLGAYEFGPD